MGNSQHEGGNLSAIAAMKLFFPPDVILLVTHVTEARKQRVQNDIKQFVAFSDMFCYNAVNLKQI